MKKRMQVRTEASLQSVKLGNAKVGLLVACALLSGLGAEVARSRGASASPSQRPWPLMAPHAPAPIVENPGGGPVATAPRIVPVFFSSDPLLSDLETYYSKLGTSTYLASGLAEYGISKPTVTAPLVRTDAPPPAIDDVAASNWLLGEITSGALPAPDGNTVYSLVFPDDTQVTAGNLGPYPYPYPLCGSTSEATQTGDGALVPFVLSTVCEGQTGSLTDIESETDWQSYALVAAIMSPGWQLDPGYSDVSWSGSAWSFFAAPYVSTLCSAYLYGNAVQTPSDLGYLVQVLWSNERARNGHDPCPVPSPAPGTYFNAAPEITGTSLGFYGMVKGIILPPGGTVTFPVRLFSDGAIAPWTLGSAERVDIAPDPYNLLSFSFDKSTGANGDVRQLTVTRAVAPDGSVAPMLAFEITSTSGTTVNEWLAMVGLY
jgi:hypothetical protein